MFDIASGLLDCRRFCIPMCMAMHIFYVIMVYYVASLVHGAKHEVQCKTKSVGHYITTWAQMCQRRHLFWKFPEEHECSHEVQIRVGFEFVLCDELKQRTQGEGLV